MSVTHETAIRDLISQKVKERCEEGSVNSNAKLQFINASSNVLASLEMSSPAFGSIQFDGSLVADVISPDTNTTAGTIEKFRIINKDEEVILEGSAGVNGSGEGLELSSLLLGSGDTLDVQSYTYYPPS